MGEQSDAFPECSHGETQLFSNGMPDVRWSSGSGLRRRRHWKLLLLLLAVLTGGLQLAGGLKEPGTGNVLADVTAAATTSAAATSTATTTTAASTAAGVVDGAADHASEPTAGAAEAAEHGGHQDPVAQVLLAITVILLAAKVAGDAFERLHLPAVLGELTVGILLGNWGWLTGSDLLSFLRADPGNAAALTGNVLDMLARLGVVLLLFEVGLETRVKDMLSVGLSSLLVAIVGVISPMLLGFGFGYVMLSESLAEWQVPAFLGATLCATSVGITARVLKDLGRSQDRESRIILGAAVIDDVLGLVVLAVVSGVIQQGAEFQISNVAHIVGLSLLFLALALGLGAIRLPRMLFRAASVLQGQGLLIVTALVICFSFAYSASLVGLAPIIGAFAAGLILEGTHYQDVSDKWRQHHLEDALAPLTALLVPIFFVAMGMSVQLSAFSDSSVWLLAAGLTVVAVIGKLACSLAVTEAGLNRLSVGLGMIPRGEVGLIFAAEGARLTNTDGTPVVGQAAFSAIVVMVMLTTMVTPPLLKWSMSRRTGRAAGSAE